MRFRLPGPLGASEALRLGNAAQARSGATWRLETAAAALARCFETAAATAAAARRRLENAAAAAAAACAYELAV